MQVTKRNGRREGLDINKIHKAVDWACENLDVSLSEIETGAHIQFFDGISTEQIQTSLIGSAAALIDKEAPDYEYAAARLLLLQIYKEVSDGEIEYPTLASYIRQGIENKRLAPEMADFDFEGLEKAIAPERDFEFKYLGMQTIYDRYLIQDVHAEGEDRARIIEMPQHFWMRVAMGIALNETPETRTAWAIKFYNLLSTFKFVNSTPTLFNSGTTHAQMSSCFVNTVKDAIWEPGSDKNPVGEGIFGTITECAMLSKFAGGIGTDWTRVRPTGSHIESTNGISSGIVPYLKVFNDTAVAVNQGGKRNGSFAAYLEPWHGDIERFITLKKPNGDERLRAREIFPALWTNDLFMERVRNKQKWSLFCSHKYPDLHELHGQEFKNAYEQYEADGGAIKVIDAEELWKKIITALVESGAPWITFKDEMNRRNPQDHVGVVHSSNLCCVTGDQRVVTDAGIFTAKELYDNERLNKVVGLSEFSDASKMLLPRPNAPIVRIDTAEGYEHKVTPDHRVWVKDKGWVEAQDLTSGDKLLTQQIEGMFGEQHFPKLALIAGLVAGDGTYSSKGPSESVNIDLWGDKTGKFVPVVEKIVEGLIEDQGLATTSTGMPKFSYNHKKQSYRLCSAPLARVLDEMGFNKSTKLDVPDFVWKGTKSTVMGYLRGLYLTDGNVQVGKDATCMALSSASIEFLKEIQILWANFGVKSSLNKVHGGGKRDFGDGYGKYECKPVWRLLITSIQGCQIAERVTMLGKYRTGDSADTFVKNLSKKGYKQKLYATFVGLTELPNEDAYCLTVDSETHAWTVNGLITHNTEIALTNDDDETAVCNLGSINMARVLPEEFREIIPIAMRMLDNVIDLNFYPTEKARNSNMRHRPVGLGMMGWTDYIVSKGIDWESIEHLQETDSVFEAFSYWAIRGSVEIAKEKGRYKSFYGSKWSRDILPIDTARVLPEEWSSFESKRIITDWAGLRKMIEQYGLRNSNCTSLAPTATIANIVGTEACIEPIFKQVFTKENKSGKFKVVAPSLRHNRPELCKVAFEIDQKWIVKAAAVRQKYLCQSQSVNIFKHMNAKGGEISSWYFLAWELGLKATYYMKQQIIELTAEEAGDLSKQFIGKTDAVEPADVQTSLDDMVGEAKICSILDPDCESCQ